MSSPVSSSNEGLAESSRDVRETSRRKLALATGQRLKQMNQHHPYRIELLDLTPVSVSVLWSTRPPPLSAIPQGIVTTPLRQRFQTRTSSSGTSSPPISSATASAVSTTSIPSSTASKSAKVSHSRHQTQSSETSSTPASARASPTPTLQDAPLHRLAEGLIATRSLNRKVTKIRLRSPSSIPASASGRRPSNGLVTPESRSRACEEEGSDEGTATVDDDGVSGSEGSDSGFEGDHKIASMVNVFESKVSVTVNGTDWPHVLMGERGSNEAIVVIFGLQPESDYDIQFEVKGGADAMPDSIRLPLRTRAERDRIADSSPGGRGVVSTVIGSTAAAVRPSSPSPLGKGAVSADEETGIVNVQKKALLQAELEASEAMKAELLTELRKARKETSKAESALRHEIESIKRHADRMSSSDHRSKQKVLALQEAIKQTTAHVKDIHEEAEEIEAEQQAWKDKESVVAQELAELRKEVDAEDAGVEAQIQANESEIAAVEKELKAIEASARSKEIERDSLQNDKLAGLEAEVSKLKAQIKDVLSRPPHARRGGHGVSRGGGRHPNGGNHIVPPQALARNKGVQGLGHPTGQGSRGGKFAHGHNARAASGPASQGGHGATGTFQGPFKTFVPGAAQGHAHHLARAYRSTQSLRPDGGANSLSIHAPFDPTMGEAAYAAGLPHLNPQEVLYGALPPSSGFIQGGGPYGPYAPGFEPDFGAAPYDAGAEPSPSSSERRSSLPLPHLVGKAAPNSVLNPNNPEFVPSASSANASPVMLKDTISGAPNTKPSNVSSQPFTSIPPSAASLEHSPTSSSRFAFPLARHAAGTISKPPTTTSLAPSPIGSDRLPATMSEGGHANSISTSAQLFPPGAGPAGPFSRGSPLLAGVGSVSGTSPLLYGATDSPRFGPIAAGADDLPNTRDSAFATSKFGPLDYDPGLEDFGPGLSLGGSSSRFAPGGGGVASSTLPFGSNAYPSLFGSSDTWTPPGAPTMPAVGSGGPAVATSFINTSAAAAPSTWVAPSPPLGGGLNMPGSTGDIWSAPSLSGPSAPSSLRSKVSLGDFGHRPNLGHVGNAHEIGADFGPGAGSTFLTGLASASGPLAGGFGSGSGSRFVNTSAPVSPTSPKHPSPAGAIPRTGQSGSRFDRNADESDMEVLADLPDVIPPQSERDPLAGQKPAPTSAGSESPPTPSFADVAAAAKRSSG